MRQFWLVTVAMVIGMSGCGGQTRSRIHGADNIPTIHVEARSDFGVPADEFVVGFTIREVADTPEAVVAAASETQNAVLAHLAKVQVDPETARPVSYWMGPHYVWEDDDRVERGFESQSAFELIVTDHSRLSDIVIALSRAGVKGEITVVAHLENPVSVRNEAIRSAIKKAHGDAKTVAAALGVRLGKINDVRVDHIHDGARDSRLAATDFQFEEAGMSLNVAVTDHVQVSASVTCWFLIEQ